MKQQRIAIGVVKNKKQQVLLAKRKAGTHLEGFWEFPGGKLEGNESFKIALRRELFEELGVDIYVMSKILEMQHQYSDRNLHFQIYEITEFSGEIQAKENQQLQWVDSHNIKQLNFPSANKAIIDALFMPHQYMIADEDVFGSNLLSSVQKQLQLGISFIQYRSSHADKKSYVALAKELRDLCAEYNAMLISNCDLQWVEEINPQGIHLNSTRMKEVYMDYSKGLSQPFEYFSASCHSKDEVEMANQLKVRCQLIGPVNKTKTHANINGIGWSSFSHLCFLANSPVYALGGMNPNEYQNAIVHGAQGFAAIRAFAN